LPVPLSPCLALARGHLFLAATPQALAAALDAAGDGPARHSSWIERVASADLGSLDDLQSLLYLDAPRFARGGYGATNALGAMLANGVRSPSDPAREAGWVWPPYRELLAGARPTVSLARIRGDDLVTLTGADRAATLQLAAFSGLGRELLSGLLMVSTLAAVVTPALTARLYAGSEVDEHVATAQGDLYQLFGAIESYVEERDGLYPQSLEDLLEPAADGVPWYDEIPRDPWGNDYIYVVDEEGAHVLSYGSDGVPGGEGDARDLTSDEVLEVWGELDGEHEHDEGQWEDEAGREGEFEGEGGDAEPEDEGDLLQDFAELSQSVTTVQGDVNLAAGGDPKAARRVRRTMRAVKAMALEVRREARVLAAAAADEGDGR
jgi:general secretion pathway protein G